MAPRRKPGPKPRAKGSLPPELLPEQITSLEESLTLGMSIKDSCRLAGLSEGSVHKWRREGAEHGGELGEFVTRIDKARLAWKRYNLARIASAARGGEKTRRTKLDRDGNVVEIIETTHAASWQAAAWILERLAPAEFARVTRLEAFGDEGEDGDRGESASPDLENVRSIIDRIASRQSEG